MTKIQFTAQDSEGNKAELTLDNLDKRLKEVETVTVKNGEEKIIPMTQAVSETWNMVYEQKQALEIWLDFYKIYAPLKKFLVKYKKPVLIALTLLSLYFGGKTAIGLITEAFVK